MEKQKKINILFFIEDLEGGGAQNVLRNLVNHMDQAEFAITVQTIWPADASGLLAPGIRYKTTYPVKNKTNQLRYRLEAELGMLYQMHVKDDYDIECAYLEMGTTKVMSASTNKKAKKLAWIHCDLSRAISNYASYIKKTEAWYEKFDRIVCVSQKVKESFDRLYQNRFSSDIVYNVIDSDRIKQLAAEPIADVKKRRLTILAVGTLYHAKNYPRLLKTHKRLLEEGVAHDLWILGDGVQRADLERYIRENDLSDSVTLFGFRDNPYPFMTEADVIVCSSNYEGFSTVITESTILGKAIVTTNCSGMEEILGKNEFGIITDNSDEGFYLGVKELLTNSELRTHYAKQARIRGDHYSARELTDRTQDYFKKILSFRERF